MAENSRFWLILTIGGRREKLSWSTFQLKAEKTMVNLTGSLKLYQATVNLRRGDGFDVRPESEQIDGMSAVFRPGWLMDDEDTSIYVGEWAMIPRVDGWPEDAPGWVASGDLVEMAAMSGAPT